MSTEPFSFQELKTAKIIEAPAPKSLLMQDGTNLALRSFIPKQPVAILVFYHGGGAHSAASYQHIGYELCETYQVATFMPDIRGHGASEGTRGDTPSTQRILQDINETIAFIKETYPHIPLFLGGHSSGAGLVLNHSTSIKQDNIDGYIFLAPQLGFRAKTDHQNNPFVQVNILPFIINSITNGLLCGHNAAVQFNYPAKVLEKGMLPFNTVNMANALTASSPYKQLRQLSLPLGVWVGEHDEVLDAKKVESFIQQACPHASIETIAKEKHLSIILAAGNLIGAWINKQITPPNNKLAS